MLRGPFDKGLTERADRTVRGGEQRFHLFEHLGDVWRFGISVAQRSQLLLRPLLIMNDRGLSECASRPMLLIGQHDKEEDFLAPCRDAIAHAPLRLRTCASLRKAKQSTWSIMSK